jgi:ribose 5-phosphate isomerase A
VTTEKINASKKALEYIKNGMVVGLGSGTTAREFIKLLAEKVKKEKWSIKCVYTSFDSKIYAMELGLEIFELDQVDHIDVSVDGADVATKIALLKGGGGACKREKILGYAAKKFIIIADETKIKDKLEGKVVVEVVPSAYSFVLRELQKISKASVRMAGGKLGPIITDNGNLLIDAEMLVKDPKEMEKTLKNIPGVVDNGIFTKFDQVIIGTKTGTRIL